MHVSVAIATYNGERFIEEQLKSILKQLNENDEVIISDDNSTDNTIKIINSFEDDRITVLKNKDKGIIKNFENAISNCRNEIIFLADQDDVWVDNKVEKIIECFNNNENIVIVQSNFYITDENLNISSVGNLKKKNLIRNIAKNNYMGSAMAFKKNLYEHIKPFPVDIPMHDMYIGLLGKKYGEVIFLEDKLFYYRRHINAVTVNKGTLKKKIIWRKNLIKCLILRYIKGFLYEKNSKM